MRKLSGAACLAAATTALALLVPAADSMAQTTAPKPSLTELVAQAKQLEFQINALSEQYDGLRIQLSRAQSDAKIANQAAARDATVLASGQQAIAQLAAENYMSAGLDPTLQALTTGNPEQFLSQASTITELDQASGDKVSTLATIEEQDQRARQTADQQIAAVQALQTQMNAKKQVIDAKIDQVNSAAMKQAMTDLHADRAVPGHQHSDREHGRRPGPDARRCPGAAIRMSGGRPARANSTARAWWSGPLPRKASRFRTSPETCGTPACIFRGPTWNPAIWCSSSPTFPTWGFTWVTG